MLKNSISFFLFFCPKYWNHYSLALGILGDAKATSKTHRIYRFLKDFNFDYMKVGYLLLSFFASKNYVVAMDRTSWKFGKSDINILLSQNLVKTSGFSRKRLQSLF
ncbi:hypothetical protein [Rickettsia endosymbiont of Oedothorax gibbosus]|uniref:hypothetical protein n=1 Tax=Rickettsia endosymbiont of Oedothorax gibbosus TaxID=931099 RepID=UPI002023C189|nr:hypothetical protein [Rickettsia endosymbiont of Oedothorax gibbosus]